KRILVFGLVLSSIPAMMLIFLVQKIVTKPLRQITEAALKVAEGDSTARVHVGTRDEAAVLASAFNDMVQRLEQDIESMSAMSEGMLRSERLATAGALAAGVAHEVNNPLAAMSSLVQLVQTRCPEADKQILEQALDQMDRIAAALKDLMELARPREEKISLGSINEVVTKTVRFLKYDKRFRTTTIQTNLAKDMPAIELDSDRLQQVIMNLLINAQHAVQSKEGGMVKILTEFDNEQVSVKVVDNGGGIPEDVQEQIFEPFFTTKAPGAGTGLGLAVCRDIARAHQGTLTLASQPASETTFTLALPRRHSESASEE
ncbi:MAG: ATP-binding protein, partial [Planctomycetota bacterium]|nr:ATP-binding protein [Planctomycetota bacterium]